MIKLIRHIIQLQRIKSILKVLKQVNPLQLINLDYLYILMG